MNIPGFRSAVQCALTLTYAAAAALLVIIVLLFAKGGDRSFFAGVILAGAGLLCACASLAAAVYALSRIQEKDPARTKLIACIAADALYITLALLSLGFAALLFCALGR